MPAVGADLPADFRKQNAPAECPRASSSLRELRHGEAADIEPQRLAEQMGVGAEVVGQMTFDVREVEIEPEEQVDRPRKLLAAPAGGLRAVHKQTQCPDPRQRAERQLQHAGPVDADAGRVGVEPVP